MQRCEKEKPQVPLKPATVTVRKFVAGGLFTKIPSGSWSLEPSVQSKETFKVTEFSKQPRDAHIEPSPVQQSDFLWTWLGSVLPYGNSPGPQPRTSELTLPHHASLFWRIFLSSNCSVFILFPKVIPTFFFLFTFKPSQALLSLWFLLTAFERFKMLFFFSCGRWHRRQGCWFEGPVSS